MRGKALGGLWVALTCAASVATAAEAHVYAFAGWVLVAALHTGLGLRSGPALPARAMRLGALVAAIILLAGPPAFSGDVYRYLLDGRLSAAGLHPFAYAPESPKIADILATLPGEVNHPHLPTIYPAGAQALFGLVGLLGGGTLLWRLILAALLIPAAVALRRQDAVGALPRDLAIAAHPLLLISLFSDGHIDALAVPIGVGLTWAIGQKRLREVGLWIGAGASLKLFPIGFPAALLGAWGLRRSLAAGLIAALSLAALYAPLVTLGPKTLGSLGTYAETWRYNAGAEALVSAGVARALEARGTPEVFEAERRSARNARRGVTRVIDGAPTAQAYVTREQRAASITRGLALALLLGLAGWAWRMSWGPARTLHALVLWLFLTSPVVHPWYLLWLLPWTAEVRSRAGWVWCGAVVLAFAAPAFEPSTGAWRDAVEVRVVQYAVVFGALVFDSTAKRHLVSERS